MFSDFTFGELWEPLAIIALVRQSKCETYIELCELCNWRVEFVAQRADRTHSGKTPPGIAAVQLQMLFNQGAEV